ATERRRRLTARLTALRYSEKSADPAEGVVLGRSISDALAHLPEATPRAPWLGSACPAGSSRIRGAPARRPGSRPRGAGKASPTAPRTPSRCCLHRATRRPRRPPPWGAAGHGPGPGRHQGRVPPRRRPARDRRDRTGAAHGAEPGRLRPLAGPGQPGDQRRPALLPDGVLLAVPAHGVPHLDVVPAAAEGGAALAGAPDTPGRAGRGFPARPFALVSADWCQPIGVSRRRPRPRRSAPAGPA